jgi:hypothetical protein
MDINYRGKDWPPIYFDPEFDEMLELTKSFDTLRIGLVKEKLGVFLVIASGYGNTHSTLSKALGEMNPRLKPNREGEKYAGLDGCAILYEEDGRHWFNMADLGGGEKESPQNALPCFPSKVRKQLSEIVKLADERLNHIST